jgi:NTE family protein
VSGGSIANGLLATRWRDLAFDESGRSGRVRDVIVEPLRRLAHQTIDVPAWIVGKLNPFSTPARTMASQFDRHLYHGMTFDRLVASPRFVINATNIATGVLFRFSQPFMGDYLIGRVANPNVRVSMAVAASGAFPPFFSPMRLDLREAQWIVEQQGQEPQLGTPEFRRQPALGDGGIYDNLGLETAWKRCRTLLVSDGGGSLPYDSHPPGGFVFQTIRVLNVIDRQVRALRKRLLIDAYQMGLRDGAYWGIRSEMARFKAPDTLECQPAATARLANVPTRLAPMPDLTIDRLVNWGYAVADAGLRTHVVPDAAPPRDFPYPAAGVG